MILRHQIVDGINETERTIRKEIQRHTERMEGLRETLAQQQEMLRQFDAMQPRSERGGEAG